MGRLEWFEYIMVLTQLQALSTHTDRAQCELIKVDPRINLDSEAIHFRHGTSMSHKEVALIQNFLRRVFTLVGISKIS